MDRTVDADADLGCCDEFLGLGLDVLASRVSLDDLRDCGEMCMRERKAFLRAKCGWVVKVRGEVLPPPAPAVTPFVCTKLVQDEFCF